MVHLIGANGYIGLKLTKYLLDKDAKFDSFSNVVDENCKFFDLSKPDCKSLNLKEDDVVVLMAAISSPDICENNYELAHQINVVGTSLLIDYCIAHKVKVIFFSSDTVNGATDDKTNDEYSEVNPYGNYAKMKYEIEKKYRDQKYFKTIRLSYVLSNEDKFTSYLNNCVKSQEKAEVFRGLYRNVILLETVLEAVYKLINNFWFNDYYLVNLSGNQNLSRADLALIYKRDINQNLEYNIVPTPKLILESRPNIIKTKSLFLEKLLGHKIKDLL